MFHLFNRKHRKSVTYYAVTYDFRDGMPVTIYVMDADGVNNAIVNDHYGHIVKVERV